MKKIIIIILILAAFSCKSTKDVQKNDTDRQLTETTKTITTRVGDTVKYQVPKIIFKDTVIKIKNTQGTTQILRYNKEGTLTETECLSSVVFLIEENNRVLLENISEMNKHKETEIPTSTILYFFVGLALFICIIFAVGFFILKKYLKTIIPIA